MLRLLTDYALGRCKLTAGQLRAIGGLLEIEEDIKTIERERSLKRSQPSVGGTRRPW